MFSYQGKKAVVTGAGRGIGRQIALNFAELGADVMLASRTSGEIENVAEEIRALGRKAYPVVTDMGDFDAALALVDTAIETMGGLDVWVNNAGGGSSVKGGIGPIEDATLEGFDALFQLNLRVPFFCARRAADHMASRGGGAILNIVSIDGVHAAPGEGIYGAAKAALISLTKTMGVEYGRHNVRINAIAPALIDTKLVERHLQTEDDRKTRASFYPLNRVGKPEDIAGAAVYFCSDEASWTSGQTLVVAGGNQATSDLFLWVRKHNEVPEDRKM
ncbi:MAG: short-chain dehydrogenase [Rhodospirillaceae bacterium]|nr:short-chain dehydrogenase [Rhodospirillaceae bacterium]|tara:strand:- start:7123 stop:7947 length:825 start_codon:yes stop_codon:yes gene_type:complete